MNKYLSSLLSEVENPPVLQETLVDKIHLAYADLAERNVLPYFMDFKYEKDTKIAKFAARKARGYFSIKNYPKALEYYNKSLCWAEKGSTEIAFGYASRAAIYFDIGLYEHCMKNCEAARKALAVTVIAEENEKKEKPIIEDLKINVEKLKKKCQSLKDDKNRDIWAEQEMLNLSKALNHAYRGVVNTISMENSEAYDNYLYSTKSLNVGDVILKEEPVVHVLHENDVYKRCYHCGNMNFFNLTPCPNSVNVMFCPSNCSKEAKEQYYDVECKILDMIYHFSSKPASTIHLTIRIIIKAIVMQRMNIQALKDNLEEVEDEITNPLEPIHPPLNFTEKFFTLPMQFLHFHAIYCLEHMPQLEPTQEELEECAIIWCLLSEYASFGDQVKIHEKFMMELIFRIMRIVKLNSDLLHEAIIDKPRADENGKMNERDLLGIGSYGLGIGLVGSYFNHSCYPNVMRVAGNSFVVTRKIAEKEPLMISYLNASQLKLGTQERRNILQDRFFFHCTCQACEGEMSLYGIEHQSVQSRLQLARIQKQMQMLQRSSPSERNTLAEVLLNEKRAATNGQANGDILLVPPPTNTLAWTLWEEIKVAIEGDTNPNQPSYKMWYLQEAMMECLNTVYCIDASVIFASCCIDKKLVKSTQRKYKFLQDFKNATYDRKPAIEGLTL